MISIPRKALRTLFLGFSLLGIVAMAAMSWLYVSTISLPISTDPHFSQTRVWAHRSGARHWKLADNAPNAITKSFAAKIDGVEMDIFYDTEQKNIIISHDYPYVQHNGQVAQLKNISVPQDVKLWLDTKNLDKLNDENIAEFAKKLQQLGLQDKAYVESQSIWKLAQLDRHHIHTVYWLSADKTKSPLYYIAIKMLTKIFGIDAVSISYQNLDAIQPHFSPSSIFTFTVNDRSEIEKLKAENAVAVVLSSYAFLP